MAIRINTATSSYQKAPFSAFDSTSQYNPSGLNAIAGALRGISSVANQAGSQIGREKKQAAQAAQEALKEQEEQAEKKQKAAEELAKAAKEARKEAENIKRYQAKKDQEVNLAKLQGDYDAALAGGDEKLVEDTFNSLKNHTQQTKLEDNFENGYTPADVEAFAKSVADYDSENAMARDAAKLKYDGFTVTQAGVVLLRGSEEATTNIVISDTGVNNEAAENYLTGQALRMKEALTFSDKYQPKLIKGIYEKVSVFHIQQAEKASTIAELEERYLLFNTSNEVHKDVIDLSPDASKEIIKIQESFEKRREELSDISTQVDIADTATNAVPNGVPQGGESATGINNSMKALESKIYEAVPKINSVVDPEERKRLFNKLAPQATLLDYFRFDSVEGGSFSSSLAIADVFELVTDGSRSADDLIAEKIANNPETWGTLSTSQITGVTNLLENLRTKVSGVSENFSALRFVVPELDAALNNKDYKLAKNIYDQYVDALTAIKKENPKFNIMSIDNVAQFAPPTGVDVNLRDDTSIAQALTRDITIIGDTDSISGTINQIQFGIRNGDYTGDQLTYNYALLEALQGDVEIQRTATAIIDRIQAGEENEENPLIKAIYEETLEDYLDVSDDRRQLIFDAAQRAENKTGNKDLDELQKRYALGVIKFTIDAKKDINDAKDVVKTVSKDLSNLDPIALTTNNPRKSSNNQTVEIQSRTALYDVVDFTLDDTGFFNSLGNFVSRYYSFGLGKPRFAPHEYAEFVSITNASLVWDQFEQEDLNPFIYGSEDSQSDDLSFLVTHNQPDNPFYRQPKSIKGQGSEGDIKRSIEKEKYRNQLAFVHGQQTATDMYDRPLIKWVIRKDKNNQDMSFMMTLEGDKYTFATARLKGSEERIPISVPTQNVTNYAKSFLSKDKMTVNTIGAKLSKQVVVQNLGDILSSSRGRTDTLVRFWNESGREQVGN